MSWTISSNVDITSRGTHSGADQATELPGKERERESERERERDIERQRERERERKRSPSLYSDDTMK